jgi:transposase
MRYVGCDVHKSNTSVAWIDDETGEFSRAFNVPTDKLGERLRAMAATVPLQVALETSTSGYFAAQVLRSLRLDAIVVDAFKAKRLLEALHSGKTDALDAMGLALLLAKGVLATAAVWVPDMATIELRELVRAREAASQAKVRTGNHIRNFLQRHGLCCPYSSLVGRRAQVWLEQCQAALEQGSAIALASYRQCLAAEQQVLIELTRQLAAYIAPLPVVKLLRTIPGVGVVLSATIAAEIGDIGRFASAANLRSYARLAPTVRQSGERRDTGPLNKHGNRLLSWALIQAAGQFSRHHATKDCRPRKQFGGVLMRHGPNPARVSLARRLASIMFAMLRDGMAFDLARLMPVAEP